tara:strand:- start:40 stop:1326 length:1287 start_codon:yes stop_codon:yes gene_type:complete
MKLRINYHILSILLIVFAVFSFFLGFHLDEISMGAGGYNGDFKFVKKSIEIFNNNSIKEAILLFSESSNRPPLIYILHKIFNPFFDSTIGFRRVVFLISLSIPVLLFLCLKERFKNTDNILLLLFTSIIFFNPFFRTSSFWGLEENYAYIALLISLLYLLKLLNLKEKSDFSIYLKLTIIAFSSSLCIYFDQKFLLVPLICLSSIINANYLIKFKIYIIFLYILFSIPYLYLISIWGGIFPFDKYNIGNHFYTHHIGFALTIIAFIMLPFILITKESVIKKFSLFFKDKTNYYLISIIFIYIIYLTFFYDNSFIENRLDGGGVIKKLSLIFFENILLRKIFVYTTFAFAWILVISFLNKNSKNFSIILYFVLISLITRPFYQEYLDPFLFFLILFIFEIQLYLKFKNVILFYLYFFIFLIGSKIYYGY